MQNCTWQYHGSFLIVTFPVIYSVLLHLLTYPSEVMEQRVDTGTA
jgi:hypothetical protein